LDDAVARPDDSSKGGQVSLFDPVARTLKVRVDVDNPRYDLRPDMFVDVEIPIAMPPSLSVPADAVPTRQEAIVYGQGKRNLRAPQGQDRLEPGRAGEITAAHGGEKVVISGTLIDPKAGWRHRPARAEGRRACPQG
jgi:multidrug efflux pump subunit AcrA (membrane-fusion protein)